MSNKHIVPIQQYADTEDYFIEIPQEICQELNWNEGDEIDWQIDNKGIIITKVKDSSSTQKEHQQINNDWYTIKEEELEGYYNSESEGKDYDTLYDDYIETSVEETSSIEGYEFP